ncbi:hypothetical protein B296_00053994, partial [Ensete ventricosum]
KGVFTDAFPSPLRCHFLFLTSLVLRSNGPWKKQTEPASTGETKSWQICGTVCGCHGNIETGQSVLATRHGWIHEKDVGIDLLQNLWASFTPANLGGRRGRRNCSRLGIER